MWVHPDFVKDEKWTTVISKQKQKIKSLNCYVTSLIGDDNDTSTSLLTDSEEQQIVLMVNQALTEGT